MAKGDYSKFPPPEPSMFGSRFKSVDMEQDRLILLWDMGFAHENRTPMAWAQFEYWDADSRKLAKQRVSFVTGMLNGIRQASEVIDF